MTIFYRGFSTQDKSSNLTNFNIQTVNEDLLNHIWTERGSRVMMPDFGTRIPLLTFEQGDEYLRRIVEEDLIQVFAYDPRVQLISLNVFILPDNNALVALADLLYLEFQVQDELRIEIQLG